MNFESLRKSEELFARQICKKNIRLEFTEDNYSSTDGKSVITVSPLLCNFYKNTDALYLAEEQLNFSHLFSANETNAIQLVTRLQVIHEALHARYSYIPPKTIEDSHAHDMKSIMAVNYIYEIIEDAFIENVGCTMGPAMEILMKFFRLMLLYSDGNKRLTFDLEDIKPFGDPLLIFLKTFAIKVLYPMVNIEVDDRIWQYMDKAMMYANLAVVTSNPENRYKNCRKIYEIVEELIRKQKIDVSGGGAGSDEDMIKENQRKTATNNPDDGTGIDRESLDRILGKSRTHCNNAEGKKGENNKPETPPSCHKLFDGSELNPKKNGITAENLLFNMNKIYEPFTKGEEIFSAVSIGASNKHKGINLKIIRPKNYDKQKDEYIKLCTIHRGIISTYRAKFWEYLHTETEVTMGRCFMGSSIDSKHLTDSKGRIWQKKNKEDGIPELAVLFMIDCSGSMRGERLEQAKTAMVIMNEVLRGQGIEYAIFGHSAIANTCNVEHTLVYDFGAKEKDKFQIMMLNDISGSREGVSLVWANRYLNEKTSAENKVIIAISDGQPIHYVSSTSCCVPPESVQDAKEVLGRIKKEGTKVIAISLDGGGTPCYKELSEMYSDVIECQKLERLPKQLLELVSKQLKHSRV